MPFGPFVPLEIVREIVEFAYAEEAPAPISRLESLNDLGVSTKPRWRTTFHSFSQTSKAYREIVLEAWFRCLRISYWEELGAACQMFPLIPTGWTRRVTSALEVIRRTDSGPGCSTALSTNQACTVHSTLGCLGDSRFFALIGWDTPRERQTTGWTRSPLLVRSNCSETSLLRSLKFK